MEHEPSINGQRFSALRRIYTLTQKALAERLEVSQSFLSQVEKGARPAPDSIVRRAGELFGLPRSFFTVGATPLENGPATFRKSSRARTRDDDRIGALYDEAARLFRTVSYESGYRSAELPDPQLFGWDPDAVASHLREVVGLGQESPVLNVTRTLERLGFGVVDRLVESDAGGDHSGITRPSPLLTRPLVALASTVPGAVKRFTLLHEAYHHIADRDLAGPITSRRSPEEARAFQFAGAFLLPRGVVQARVSEDLPLHGFLPIKADYGISVGAAIRRAQDVGVISASRAKSLYIQWSSAGWRTNEPVSVPDESPQLLGQALHQVYGRHPVHKAADAVGTSPEWIQRWCRFEDFDQPPTPADHDKVVDLNRVRRNRRP